MSVTDSQGPAGQPQRLLAVNAAGDLQTLLAAVPAAVHTISLAELHTATGHFDLAIVDAAALGSRDWTAVEQLQQQGPRVKVVVVMDARDPLTVCRWLRVPAFALISRPLTKGCLDELFELAERAGEGWEADIELLSGSARWLQFRIACKLDAAERTALLLRELSDEVDREEIDELSTACREMLLNAIEHGGRCDPTQSVYLHYVISDVALILCLRDPGPGFSLSNLTHAAVSNPGGPFQHAEIREKMGIRPGGFGILLAQNLVHELIYSERGNEVILIKHRRSWR